MSDTQELELLVTQLKPLSTAQRQIVHEQAATVAIGKPPRKEEIGVSKLTGLDKGIIAALVIVFISSVLLSATRIVIIGQELTSHIINIQFIILASGFLVLTLAEVASIVFITALSKYNDRTTVVIFYSLTLASFVFSVIGNLAVEKPWLSNENIFYTMFAWLLAIFPPLFVAGVGYALKTILIDRFKERYISEAKYDTAVKDYERYLSDVETHPKFSRLYAQFLVEAVMKNNTQYGTPQTKAVIESLMSDKTIEEQNFVKRVIAKREMSADTWYDTEPEIVTKLTLDREVSNVKTEVVNEISKPEPTKLTLDNEVSNVKTEDEQKRVKRSVDTAEWDQKIADNISTVKEIYEQESGNLTAVMTILDPLIFENAIADNKITSRTIRRKLQAQLGLTTN